VKKTLAIYDSDSVYATRFMEYFKNKKEFEWEVSAFTKKEKLEAFLQGQRIEILLLGPLESMEDLPSDKVKYNYQLMEEHHEESVGQALIYKYQSVEQIMEKLLTDYMHRQDETSTSKTQKQMSIVTIFSPNPSAQDGSFAWSIGFQLSKLKKVLFLPLELFSLRQLGFIEPAKQGLSEFIYYLKENSNAGGKLKELLGYSNNLSYLSGAVHGFDLLSLNKEDATRWVTILRSNTDYQSAVFYLGFYHETSAELMRLSDNVIVMNGQSPYDKALTQEWERQMDCIGIDVQKDKFRTVYRTPDWNNTVTYHTMQELACSTIWQQAQECLKS
jgi:hypothetical protein